MFFLLKPRATDVCSWCQPSIPSWSLSPVYLLAPCLIRPSTFVKKWSFDYQKVIKTHLVTYLWDSSDSSDGSINSDSSESSDSNDTSDSNDQTTLYTKIFYFPITYLPTYLLIWQ